TNCVRQVVKRNPHVASGRAGEVIAPDAVVLGRELAHPVRIAHLAVFPEYLSSLGIELDSFLFADCKPLLPFPLLCLRFTSGCAFHSDHTGEKPAKPRTRRIVCTENWIRLDARQRLGNPATR